MIRLFAGATDCHMHVLGPFARFPLAAERAYNVAEAPIEAYQRMAGQVGLERTVLVQASGHGFDNRAMLAALARLGARGRGVAVVPLDIERKELDALHAAGVRGVRLNLVTLASRHAGDPARLVQDYERLIAPLGWHLQLFARPDTITALAAILGTLRVEVVIDHMGLPDAAAGTSQPGFRRLLECLESSHVWVKLAGADRITHSTGRLSDAVPFMRALAAVAPERLLWGSDWPHIGFHSGRQVRSDALLPYRELDEGELLDVLAEALPDGALRRAILADNPARLYAFTP